jgi:hypothetical protein
VQLASVDARIFEFAKVVLNGKRGGQGNSSVRVT